MTRRSVIYLMLLGAVGTACQEPSAPRAAPAAPPPAGSTAQDALAALDPRTPVPLQPMMAWHQKQNMMAHLVAVQEIAAALAAEDFAAAAEASRAIESSPRMRAMCEHMGSGAEGFTSMALEFHRRADAIGAAARREDLKDALQATAHTLEACTSCHAKYRQDVVTADAWQARTGSAHQPAGHHGDPSMSHGHAPHE